MTASVKNTTLELNFDDSPESRAALLKLEAVLQAARSAGVSEVESLHNLILNLAIFVGEQAYLGPTHSAVNAALLAHLTA